MTHAFFDPPVFIREIMKVSVNLRLTPCFALVGHYPVFLESLPTGFKELRTTQSQPDFMVGTPYRVSEVLPTQYKPGYGEQTQLKFAADLLTYPCLPATTETAAAFGMVLVEPGQGIHVDSPVLDLDQVDMNTACLPVTSRPTKARVSACWAGCAPIWSTTIFRMSSFLATRICPW